MEHKMTKQDFDLQFSARALEQMQDLQRWLGKDEAAQVIESAIWNAWRLEGARQYGYVGVPWVVRPGAHQFQSEAAAMRWLEEQGAEPVSPNRWAADDVEGNPIVWELEPLRSVA
jgi:hypothetical protein